MNSKLSLLAIFYFLLLSSCNNLKDKNKQKEENEWLKIFESYETEVNKKTETIYK
jgi:hypothetical protein